MALVQCRFCGRQAAAHAADLVLRPPPPVPRVRRRLAALSLLQPLQPAARALLTASSSSQHQDSLQAPSATPGQADVRVPLCRRPPAHQESVDALVGWHSDVQARIAGIGNAFEAADGGPDADGLQREVTWALEDAVAEVQRGAGASWQPCQWQQLLMEHQLLNRRSQPPQPPGPAGTPAVTAAGAQGGGAATSEWQVKMRAPLRQLREWWRQRLEDRVPFQYLISSAHWRSYVLSVAPGVLIPRPETELLPELAERALSQRPELAELPWADLGTGSGAIALGLADVLRRRCKAARVLAVDLSPAAVAHARFNAAQAGLQRHVTVLSGSWLTPVHSELARLERGGAAQQPAPHSPQDTGGRAQPLDDGSGGSMWEGPPRLGGILSNPPYIPRAVMEAGLQAEVGRHEPWSALDGGPGEGLDSLQVICEGAVQALVPGGFLALETAGGDQAHRVAELLRALQGGHAFQDVRVVDDCYGVPRFVTAHRA